MLLDCPGDAILRGHRNLPVNRRGANVDEDTGSNMATSLSPLSAAAVLIDHIARPRPLALDLSLNDAASVPFSEMTKQVVGVFPSAIFFASKSLTALDLSHRQLVKVPEALGSLVRLVYLGVVGNRLRSLSANALMRLTELRELHADENELCALPPLSCLGALKNLQVLGLSRNGLCESDIPFGIASALPELRQLRI